ncbi:hypothetical protein L1D52_24510 [Vibrio brasiliensis]|uniref:hypothetical protein n=1 Tax=Vibrio brasiliensis TaxID=170652 RepID=UPI001EFDEA10|nr:hypothetical protein [Vibrio brasiliensis]MCG9785467.1 hypothetical protein [Vibrio brasiliensis]
MNNKLLTPVALSNLGDGLFMGAIPLISYTLTSDPLIITLLSIVRPLSIIMCGYKIETLTGNLSKSLYYSSVCRILVLFALLFLSLMDMVSVFVFGAIVFIFSFMELIYDSTFSTLPKIVSKSEDDIKQGYSKLQVSTTLSNDFIGPPLAALILTITGNNILSGLILVLVVVSFLLSSPVRKTLDSIETSKTSSLTSIETTEGFNMPSKAKSLLTYCCSISLFTGAFTSVYVIHILSGLNFTKIDFGFLMVFFSIGVILNHFVLSKYLTFTPKIDMFISICLIFLGTLITAVSELYVMLGLAQLLAGIGFVRWMVNESYIKQKICKIEDLNVLNAKFRMYETIAFSSGALISGVILKYTTFDTFDIYTLLFILEMVVGIIFYKNYKEESGEVTEESSVYG